MKTRPERQPWQLHVRDFTKKQVYAKQDWRFQMFFEYLRLSPSFLLAVESNEQDLVERLKDNNRATAVWKTWTDMGNIFEVVYKDWWLENGLRLFGVHTSKPRVQLITRLSPLSEDDFLIEQSTTRLTDHMNGHFAQQGRPDSVLISIPLGQKRTTTIRELKKLLSEVENKATPYIPSSLYQVQNNKMQYRRLLAGVRLMYMRARHPNEDLWRIAARAKISHSHGRIDPNAPKKDLQNAQGRRMLTIMASRLIRDTLIIAENAATGIFPSLNPIDTTLFDAEKLGWRLKETIQWEKVRKAEIMAFHKASLPITK
jgi:hypothetical protein